MGTQTAWGMGYSGSGMVVSCIDTGARYTHQQLNNTYRSENGWFDPYGETTTPQPGSHGTSVTGVMSGENDHGGHTIGVAPASQWIACRAGTSGFSQLNIEACANWMVMTSHPDVVNNSFSSGSPGCNDWYKDDIGVMKSAGIFVAIGAGNSTFDGSPANSSNAFSVGATNSSGNIMSGSGQGPSLCTAYLFPRITAPGVDNYTTSSSSNTSYHYFSGTSSSSPHAAAAAALVMQAHPSWTISQVEEALMFNAEDLGASGFDTIFGTGEIYIPDAINHTASTLTMSEQYVHLCYPNPGAVDVELTCSGYTGSLSWYSYDSSIVTVTPLTADTALAEVAGEGYTFVTVTDSAGDWGWTLVSVNNNNGTNSPNDCTCCALTPSYIPDICYQGTSNYYQQQFTVDGSGNYFWEIINNTWWIGSIDQNGLFTAYIPNQGGNCGKVRCNDLSWDCYEDAIIWVSDCCDDLYAIPDQFELTANPEIWWFPTQQQLEVLGTTETVYFASTNPSVATVTEEGLVEAISGGCAEIKVWTYEYCYTFAEVKVYETFFDTPLGFMQILFFSALVILILGYFAVRRHCYH